MKRKMHSLLMLLLFFLFPKFVMAYVDPGIDNDYRLSGNGASYFPEYISTDNGNLYFRFNDSQQLGGSMNRKSAYAGFPSTFFVENERNESGEAIYVKMEHSTGVGYHASSFMLAEKAPSHPDGYQVLNDRFSLVNSSISRIYQSPSSKGLYAEGTRYTMPFSGNQVKIGTELKPIGNTIIRHTYTVQNDSNEPITFVAMKDIGVDLRRGTYYQISSRAPKPMEVKMLGYNQGLSMEREGYRLNYVFRNTPDGPNNFSSFGLPTSYNTSIIQWDMPDMDHYANTPWLYKPYQNNSIHGAGMENDGYQPNQVVVPNQFSNKNETGVTMKWDEVTLKPGEYKDFTYDVQLMGDFGILYLFNNTNPDKENTYSAGDIVKFEPSGNWNKEDYKLKEGTIETTVSEYVDLKENDDVIVEANKTSGDGLEAVEIKRVKVKDVYDETTRKISVPVSKEEVAAIKTDVNSMGIDFYGQLNESSPNQRVYQQATINFVDSKDNHVYTRTQPIEFDVDDFEWVAPDVYELSVDKHVSEEVAFVGDTVHYRINASNTAKSTGSIDSLVLTDKMPEGLSKPQQVKIDNQLINENQIKWDSSKREWELPLGEIAKGDSKQITYESVIEKGSKDEVKTNVVTFGSEETEEWTVTDEASFIIDEKINWTVSFDSLGGSPITSQIVEDGQKVEVPKNPEDEQREFKGWYTTENLTILYDFNQPVIDNITLYAKWRSSIVDPIDGDKVIEPTNPVNKTTEDLRIQYVSDFNFGENRNDLSELSVKANEDSVIGEKNVKRKVPAFVSIIDDRPQTTRISSPWELRVKNTSFKDSSGHELSDTSIILSDLNFQGQRKNPKVTSGEIDISNKVQKIASSDNQPEGTSWSLALGKLDNEETTGVTFYSPSGFYKNATQYNSIVDWQLVPKINE